jgi:hypothetical protein
MLGRHRKGDLNARDTIPLKHICSVCQRPRRHLPCVGDSPISHVCTWCIRKSYLLERIAAPQIVVVHEIYYYFHTCACTDRGSSKTGNNGIELPTSSLTLPCAELLGKGFQRLSVLSSFSSRLEDWPPLVHTWRKPRNSFA